MSNKEKINELAKILEFKLNNQELEKISQEFNTIEESLKTIKNLNLEKTKITSFVNEIENKPQWQDDKEIKYDPKEVFSNCESFNNEYVRIKNEK